MQGLTVELWNHAGGAARDQRIERVSPHASVAGAFFVRCE